MPHIKSNVNLEKSFGKFSTSYLSESKRLEIKVQQSDKICQILIIGIISIGLIALIWDMTGLYLLTHLNGKI